MGLNIPTTNSVMSTGLQHCLRKRWQKTAGTKNADQKKLTKETIVNVKNPPQTGPSAGETKFPCGWEMTKLLCLIEICFLLS